MERVKKGGKEGVKLKSNADLQLAIFCMGCIKLGELARVDDPQEQNSNQERAGELSLFIDEAMAEGKAITLWGDDLTLLKRAAPEILAKQRKVRPESLRTAVVQKANANLLKQYIALAECLNGTAL